jgi:hypothetical protein
VPRAFPPNTFPPNTFPPNTFPPNTFLPGTVFGPFLPGPFLPGTVFGPYPCRYLRVPAGATQRNDEADTKRAMRSWAGTGVQSSVAGSS